MLVTFFGVAMSVSISSSQHACFTASLIEYQILQQLDVKLRAGRVELSNFALNCDALMAAAAAGGSGGKSSSSNASSSNGFKVTSATVRHLRVHIAYADLLSESLTLHIEGV
eukprot:17963-Heterococcus_DN1.PRE.1